MCFSFSHSMCMLQACKPVKRTKVAQCALIRGVLHCHVELSATGIVRFCLWTRLVEKPEFSTQVCLLKNNKQYH